MSVEKIRKWLKEKVEWLLAYDWEVLRHACDHETTFAIIHCFIDVPTAIKYKHVGFLKSSYMNVFLAYLLEKVYSSKLSEKPFEEENYDRLIHAFKDVYTVNEYEDVMEKMNKLLDMSIKHGEIIVAALRKHKK